MSTPALRRGVVASVASLDLALGSDRPAPSGELPYVQLEWDIATTTALSGDARVIWSRNEIQLSLWEAAEVEDGSVALLLTDAIDGLKADGQRLAFTSSQRMSDPDGADLVHTVISFAHRSPFPA